MRLIAVAGCVALTAISAQGAGVATRALTFEQRIQAQEAIERVTYAHQIGATRPFEEVVTRDVLERKVRTSLRQSAALEAFWKTPVTSEMLRREMERIVTGTRMPARLRELFEALGNDPVLIQECLARPALVDRLTRSFFASDAVVHEKARREAEALHEELESGRLDPRERHPRRTLFELVRASGVEAVPEPGGSAADDARNVIRLDPEAFEKHTARLPQRIGAIGAMEEDSDSFVTRVVLDSSATRIEFASYLVAKVPWDEWWASVEATLEWESLATVALSDVLVPNLPSRSRVPADDSCALDDEWEDGLRDVPDPRSDHTAVWTGNVMIVWGGYDGRFLDTGSRYDPVIDVWARTSRTGAPSGRRLHTAVWTGTSMVVWGGAGAGTFNTGGRYDPATDVWTPTTLTNAPAARDSHVAVWTGSRMIVWAGTQPSGGRYDPAADSWSGLSTAGAPNPARSATAIWTGNLMIVWGGLVGFNPIGYASGGRYNPATDTWSPVSASGPYSRVGHTAVWTGTRMIVWGGRQDSTRLDSGGQYNPVTDSWTLTSLSGAPTPRSQHTAIWTGSLMIVWGGLEGGPQGTAASTGGRYDPAADVWTPVSTGNVPERRSGHSAVWTGGQMLVWGGTSLSRLNSGGRYDPATDSWTPTAVSFSPPGRRDFTAVWTGSHLIVWGGAASASLNSGGRYDPTLDVWSPTSTIDAPSARVKHTAVWTGNSMVVWGGSSGPRFATGGRYDPVADVWVPTSTIDAPSARERHTAVWTGDVMIVWGGYDGSSLDTGSRYDPVSDVWSPMSLLGDHPAARADHTAVWTGSLMIVWGGNNPSLGHVNSGGRYDPVGDVWSQTSTINAPSPRLRHTATWAGDVMVVWGGSGSTAGYLGTGGRYDPLSDAWTPTSTANAPLSRFSHSAIWTGDLVVVWGGQGQGQGFLNTGGRYNPINDLWTATSTVEAPSLRSEHRAVWTGTSMVVWGGFDGAYPETWGRYVVAPFVDEDGDGFDSCKDDCDDADAAIHPGAAELCDARDNDCSGTADGFPTSCGDPLCVQTGMCIAGVDNCVPLTPGPEACNSIDDDCDGSVDEDFDVDHDGFTTCEGDCDDGRAAVHPGVAEVCDALDNDCNGVVDGFTTWCGTGGCFASGVCSEGANTCVPGLPSAEYCDLVDNDCDGPIDEIPVGSVTVMVESDQDASLLTWDWLEDATAFDVVLGDVGILRATGGDFTAAIQGCLVDEWGDTTLTLGATPDPGAAFFYLVRGGSCLGQGTYDSGASSQVGLRDAEIDTSPSSCPAVPPFCGDGYCSPEESCDCFDCYWCCYFGGCGP
ncbi:MAG TPA: MopE-related protein [Candidatus Polarisedimenticolia bacterium]|nr:MopE-related protein [Candidatus Polarisedimenticolia bacterium]